MTGESITSEPQEVADVLNRGGVAIVPTDTVYGVAASLQHPEAVARIYDLKQRPPKRPIPVLVSDTNSVSKFGRDINEETLRLVAAFWPGPLTIIVAASPEVPEICLAGGTTVGLRMPNHPQLLALIASCGGALAVTSANKSGDPETTSAIEAFASLDSQTDIVLDTGPTPGIQPSTVVEAGPSAPRFVRVGVIPENCILDALRRP